MSLLQLRAPVALAGVACLSGYLPLSYKPGVVNPANAQTPVAMWHGTSDPVVRCLPLCLALCVATRRKRLLSSTESP